MGIASDVRALGEDIIASYDTRVRAIGVLVGDVDKMLKGFTSDRKKMSVEQAKALANFVAGLTKDVNAMIKGFQKDHKEMADNLKAGLAKGEGDRLKDFHSMMKDIQKGVKDIEAYVANKLKEFNQAHADMSEKLKKELAKYVNDMVAATRKLMGDIQKRQKERNADVSDLLAAFGAEREKMAASWQAMAATMEKRRGGKPIPVKVEARQKVKTVEEAVKEKPKAEPKAGPKPKTPEGQILALLREHTEGMTLPNLGNEAGCHFIKLTSPMRGLLDKGKVRKEDNLYFIA